MTLMEDSGTIVAKLWVRYVLCSLSMLALDMYMRILYWDLAAMLQSGLRGVWMVGCRANLSMRQQVLHLS